MLPINQIIQGDCIEILKGFPEESIDMIFSDPPFNVGKPYGIINDNKREYFKWCERWIKECFRVLKPTGSFYLMNLRRNLIKLLNICNKFGIYQNIIIWKNVSSVGVKTNFWEFYQPILFFTKTDNYTFNTYAETKIKARWSPRPQKGQLGNLWIDIPFVYSGSIHHREAIIDPKTNKKVHPTQMPEKLAERCILFSTNEGDIVLDPFVGSGTTCVVAQRFNRKWIGIEINPKFCELSRQRIMKVPMRLDKFLQGLICQIN